MNFDSMLGLAYSIRYGIYMHENKMLPTGMLSGMTTHGMFENSHNGAIHASTVRDVIHACEHYCEGRNPCELQ